MTDRTRIKLFLMLPSNSARSCHEPQDRSIMFLSKHLSYTYYNKHALRTLEWTFGLLNSGGNSVAKDSSSTNLEVSGSCVFVVLSLSKMLWPFSVSEYLICGCGAFVWMLKPMFCKYFIFPLHLLMNMWKYTFGQVHVDVTVD